MYCKICGNLLDETDISCKICGAEVENKEKLIDSEVIIYNTVIEDSKYNTKNEEPKDYEIKKEPTDFSDNSQKTDTTVLNDNTNKKESIGYNFDIIKEDLIRFNENIKKEIGINKDIKKEIGINEDIKKEVEFNDDIKKSTIEDKNAKSDENEFSWNVHNFPKERKIEDIIFDWRLDPNEHVKDKPTEIYLEQSDNEKIAIEMEENIEPQIELNFEPVKIEPQIDLNFEPVKIESQIKKTTEASDGLLEQKLFREINENDIKNQALNIDKFFTFSKKNEEFQELLDKQYELIRNNTQISYVNDEFNETTDIKQDNELHTPEFEPIIKDKDTQFEDIEQNIKVTEPQIQESASHIKEMSDARTSFFHDNIVLDNETIKRNHETNEIGDNIITTASTDVETEESKNVNQNPENVPQIVFPHEEEEAQTKNKRGCLSKVFLTIIAIILLIEIIILGIKYYAPESNVNVYIEEAQTKVISTITVWVDSIKDLISGDESSEPVDQQDSDSDEESNTEESGDINVEEDGVPDPTPVADMSTLISSQLYQNANIEQVRANETLRYAEGKDYGKEDINLSKPIENNIWITQEGQNVVYYDRSIVGTLIAFDSQWIDYVNEGDKKVINLIKKDSRAYNNAVNFTKVGKVKETFRLLEIGELRQGEYGFYAWVHEEIQILENSSTYNKKYNWIYYLEPVDGQMKIVNYFKF